MGLYAEKLLSSVYDESFELESLDLKISKMESKSRVEVYDRKTKETTIAEYDINSKMLIVNGEKVDFKFEVTTEESGIKYNFDINFVTVGVVIAALSAIAVLVSAIATAGLTWAVFTNVIKGFINKWLKIGGGSMLGVSFNGYFTFDQEVNSTYTMARNKNRYLYTRFGYGNSYEMHNFGDGSWFEIARGNE